MPLKYSVVIPVYNERENLASCIRSVRRLNSDCQIIVSDGGSQDGSLEVASREGVLVCCGQLGRGMQLNRGAQEAKGEILMFLHADTSLPVNAFAVLEKYFSCPEVKLGTFRLRFDSRHWFLRLCGFMTRFDTILTRFGDQCICVRLDLFKQLGGFPEWPLFEDVDFLRRARRKTKIHSFPAEAVTSARKFKHNGPIRQQINNGILILKYLAGVSPEKLAKEYRK